MPRGNVLVVMAIDVARSSHILPCNRRVPRLEVVRQAAGRFGNDLQAAGDGIDRARVGLERLAVESRGEADGEVNVMRDVAQG